MQQFDYNKYLKNNPLLKESIEESNIISQEQSAIIKRISNLILPYGFKQVRINRSQMDESDIALFKNKDGDDVRIGISDIDNNTPYAIVGFAGSNLIQSEDAPIIYNPKWWKKIMGRKMDSISKYPIDNNNNEEDLYQNVANEIGEDTLQDLLDSGWDLEDIAQDPQGAADSL
jgi:hypothetical protein